MRIAAAVLCGGESRRMGTDKALLPFRGKALAQHSLDKLQPLFTDIFILSSKKEHDIFSYPRIPDVEKAAGPLSALAAALQNSRADAVLLLACDTPFLPADLLQQLRDGFLQQTNPILSARHNGKAEPLCAVYSKSLLPEILLRLSRSERRMMDLLAAVQTSWLDWPDDEVFRNLNQAQDIPDAI